MSFQLVKATWELKIPSTEKMVLMCLAEHANKDGKCWPSVSTIARKCSKKVRTTQGALKRLRELGYFKVWDHVGGRRSYLLDIRKICTPAVSASPQKLCETGAECAPYPRKKCVEPPQNLRPNRSGSDKEEINNTSSARPVRAQCSSKPDPFPRFEWCPAPLWSDFLENRLQKKKANTTTAHNGLRDDLDRLATDSWPALRLLQYATAKGWASINPPDEDDYDGQCRGGDRIKANSGVPSRDCHDGLERAIYRSLADTGIVIDASENGRSRDDGDRQDRKSRSAKLMSWQAETTG